MGTKILGVIAFVAIAAKAITPKIFVPILLLFLGIYHFIINCGSFTRYLFPEQVIPNPFFFTPNLLFLPLPPSLFVIE